MKTSIPVSWFQSTFQILLTADSPRHADRSGQVELRFINSAPRCDETTMTPTRVNDTSNFKRPVTAQSRTTADQRVMLSSTVQVPCAAQLDTSGVTLTRLLCTRCYLHGGLCTDVQHDNFQPPDLVVSRFQVSKQLAVPGP